MEKSDNVNAALNKMAEMAFGTDRIKNSESRLCVKCSKPALIFTDDLSSREYQISGLCQECQDIFFAEEEL